MTDTLLVAIGDSDRERIDDFAAEIERLAGDDATVVLFHAFGSEAYADRAREVGLNEYEGGTADGLARRYKPIVDLRTALPEEIDVRVRGSSADDVASAILQAARHVDADQLLLGGRRRTPVGKATFGSTAQRVVLRADRPVTTIRNDAGSAFRTLRNAI